MTNMTAAEFRAIRAGLGVTCKWLAAHVGVRTRAVQRWEAGTSGIKTDIADAILILEAEAAEQVARHVAAFTDHHPTPVMVIEDTGHPDDWPPGWQRQIAFRVRQQVPGLRIIDGI